MNRVCIYCREEVGGSISDLRSKKKGSNKSLNVGGSLMNIGNKQVGIKKLASSGNIEKVIAKSHHIYFQSVTSWTRSEEEPKSLSAA